MTIENVEKFTSELKRSLHEKTFVKLTLGNYKGADKHLQKILVRLIETKKGARLFFLYRYDMRDTAKNYDIVEGIAKVKNFLETEFFAAYLFTTQNDFQLEIGKKRKSRLNTAKPTFKTKPTLEHNREKQLQVNPNSFYLHALGIATDKGEIRDKQQDKWKQINKFVETLGNLFENSLLKNRKHLKIVDMGSGKGYLTFAAYDYFKNTLGIEVKLTGVDTKKQLVELCNDIAKANDFEGLNFVHDQIGNYDLPQADVLIALHACNTATDDAIFKGIKAGADLIVCSPCCHREIRPQIKIPGVLKNVLKHGILLEREAESITDGIRALLLERSGYAAKIFEFIPSEHTPKNNLIVGTKTGKNVDRNDFDEQIKSIKDFYGINRQKLETLLN